jgi:hypothetical protein
MSIPIVYYVSMAVLCGWRANLPGSFTIGPPHIRRIIQVAQWDQWGDSKPTMVELWNLIKLGDFFDHGEKSRVRVDC